MRNSPFITQNPKFAAGVNLEDWRGPDTAMYGSANLGTAGSPLVTSKAKNSRAHHGRWNGCDTPPTGPAWRGTNRAWILHMVSKLSVWSGATEAIR